MFSKTIEKLIKKVQKQNGVMTLGDCLILEEHTKKMNDGDKQDIQRRLFDDNGKDA